MTPTLLRNPFLSLRITITDFLGLTHFSHFLLCRLFSFSGSASEMPCTEAACSQQPLDALVVCFACPPIFKILRAHVVTHGGIIRII